MDTTPGRQETKYLPSDNRCPSSQNAPEEINRIRDTFLYPLSAGRRLPLYTWLGKVVGMEVSVLGPSTQYLPLLNALSQDHDVSSSAGTKPRDFMVS